MKRFTLCLFVMLAVAVFVAVGSAPAYAVDGVVLINQNTAISGLPGCGTLTGFLIYICQPGSYRLSGNITVSDPSVTAILISSDNVTLDLNGFLIQGPTVCSGSPVTCNNNGSFGTGVVAEGVRTPKNVTVRNGTIRGFAYAGVALGVLFGQDDSNGNVAEDIHADGNLFGILSVSGIVRHCTAINNSEGINLGVGTVADSVASGNAIGIILGGGTAIGNTVYANNGTGLLMGSKTGYAHNALFDNGANVSGGINLGGNSCGTSTCP